MELSKAQLHVLVHLVLISQAAPFLDHILSIAKLPEHS